MMTFMFPIVTFRVTHKRASIGFASVAIGLALMLDYPISILVTNAPVNPAHSAGHAIFVDSWTL